MADLIFTNQALGICILHALQCPARVDIESPRSESEKNSLSLFVREVKSEMKICFTHFENEK